MQMQDKGSAGEVIVAPQASLARREAVEEKKKMLIFQNTPLLSR